MLPSADCDDCTPAYVKSGLTTLSGTSVAASYLPFIFTFAVSAAIAAKKLLPALRGPSTSYRPDHVASGSGSIRALFSRLGWMRWTARRAAAVACVITIALSAVLAELILCEVSDTINPTARGNALRTTLSSLLLLIILLVPALEIHSTLDAFVGQDRDDGYGFKTHIRPTQIGLTLLILAAWLVSFWYLPYAPMLPPNISRRSVADGKTSVFLQACLKRIGIIGIALMATLAGFAAVSSIWQTLGARKRTVRETEITRKETGLSSVRSMLESKQSRLRAVDRRMSTQPAPSKGFLARIAGSIKGDSDGNERRALEMEISGLETMAGTLENSLAGLKASFEAQKRSTTPLGRMMNTASTIFAVYCLYRLATISYSTTRRVFRMDSAKNSTHDPISNILALLTAHYDSALDYHAWSRQISFAMSGVILLLSFSAVLQTFRLFSRFMPGLVHKAQSSLPLIISQIAGTYVISSALLLRSNLPPEVSSVIAEALGSPLDAVFAEAWFEGWFLAAAGATMLGILLSRKLGSGEWDDWDDDGGLEMGKMN